MSAGAPEGSVLPKLVRSLIDTIPGSVILPSDTTGFKDAIDGNWAQQNREIIPACIVRPRDVHELGKAVSILKKEHDDGRNHQRAPGSDRINFFAVRSGGANTGLGAATVRDGVVIDLSLFSEVTLSADGSSVTLGTGSKWIDVYKALDEKGLVVMGGRNSPVGVGGLTLQGGISFYSPRHGFVCSNALSYEVVVADGSVVTASATENPDLWRVLKGGGNNFGIVTRFTMRAMPSEPIWVGQIFAPAAFQHAKARVALHDYVANASSGRPNTFDENAAGPIVTFAYIQSVGLQAIALHFVYTKPSPEIKKNKWPAHWKGTNAPPGTRHVQGTTTIRNDLETMDAAYAIFSQTTTKLRHVKGLLLPFIYQAILPDWMNKGHPNILGLAGCSEPLIILAVSVTWKEAKDDELVRSTLREMLEEIESAAKDKGTDHPYRFMNYCMEWQQPYAACSKEELQVMGEASRKYDPDGLFQTGCVGGFKLPNSITGDVRSNKNIFSVGGLKTTLRYG
ncbi:hypothetical protein V8F20_006594 [Naviculisporaceae sp. PSN 640]